MSEPEEPIPLGYSAQEQRRAPEPLYWVSLVCGIMPLLAAIVALIGYWATENHFFVAVGIADLKFGGISVAMGLIACVVYGHHAKRDTVGRAAALRRSRIALIILLVNVPTAIFCAFVGGRMVFNPILHFAIHNHSSATLDSGVLTQGSAVMSFGAVEKGSHVDLSHRISPGPFTLEISRMGAKQKVMIQEYMDGDDIGLRQPPAFVIGVHDDKIVVGSARFPINP